MNRTLLAALMVATPVWHERAPMPLPRAGTIAGNWKNRLLVAGGSWWDGGVKHYTSRADLFDPVTNRWSPLPPLPEARADAATAATTRLFALGGGADGQLTDSVLEFTGKSWRAVPEMRLPSPTDHGAAAVIGSDIYLLPGFSKQGEISSAGRTIYRFRAGHWEALPEFPGAARVSAAVASCGGKVYVFGGVHQEIGKAVENLRDAWSFEPAMNRWTRLPDLPVARRAWSAVSDGTEILISGGYTDTFADEIFSYETKTPKYKPAGKLPHAIADTRMVRIGPSIFNVGGESGDRIRASWTLERK
jgi:hypothetical protein